MRLTILGAGYVGLTTGACLAETGHTVTCIDVDLDRVRMLEAGQVPIYEPGLADLIKRNMKAGRLRFSAHGSESIASADAVFLAVGTPSAANGDIDLTGVERAARQIAPALRTGAVVAIKSTVIPGTARRIAQAIAAMRGTEDFAVVSNPEFLREGSAIGDFLEADRIVVGADEEWAVAVMEDVYEPLRKRNVPIVLTGTVDAELVKYTSNAFLAMKIGFINNIADLCEKAGADIHSVTRGVGLDKRIGPAFLPPGPGFGGSCFPKDLRALAAAGRQLDARQTLVECVLAENENRKKTLARRIAEALPRGRAKRRVCILGVAFKANTDDVREAPALTIVPELLENGIEVAAHDPRARKEAEVRLGGVSWFDDPLDAASGADCVVVLTEWEEYRAIDLRRLARSMRGRTLIDCRNVIDPRQTERCGLSYIGLGRGRTDQQPEKARSYAGPRSDPRRAARATVL